MLLTATRPATFTPAAVATRPAARPNSGASAVKRFFRTLLRALAAPTA